MMEKHWLTTIYESTVHLVLRLRGGLFANGESAQPHFAACVIYTEPQGGGGSNLQTAVLAAFCKNGRLVFPNDAWSSQRREHEILIGSSSNLRTPPGIQVFVYAHDLLDCIEIHAHSLGVYVDTTIVVFSCVTTQQLLLVTPTSGTRSPRMLLKTCASQPISHRERKLLGVLVA